MSHINTNVFDGDVSVGRHVSTGGDVKVAGDVTVGHGLKVMGWLEARNVKHANKGMFLTVEALEGAYASPREGWWALVGDGLPAAIYVGHDGKWVATGKTGGEITIDVEQYWTVLQGVRDEVSGLNGEVEDVKVSLQEARADVAGVKVALSGYATMSSVEAAKAEAVESAKAYVDEAVGDVDLSGYATEAWVDGKVQDVNAYIDDVVGMVTMQLVYDKTQGVVRIKRFNGNVENGFVIPTVGVDFPGLMSAADKAKLDAMHSFEERLAAMEEVVASISTEGVEARVRAIEDALTLG